MVAFCRDPEHAPGEKVAKAKIVMFICCNSATGEPVARCRVPKRKKPSVAARAPNYPTITVGYAPAISSIATLTPGPIEELTDTFFTNLPFAPDGFALTIASM